jgi:hypothetical protein
MIFHVPAPVNEMVNCYITIIWLDMICHVPAPVNEMFNCYITIIWLDMICHVPAPVNEMVNCYITIKVWTMGRGISYQAILLIHQMYKFSVLGTNMDIAEGKDSG